MQHRHVGTPSSAGLVIAGLVVGLLIGVGIGAHFAGTPAATAVVAASADLDVQPDAVSQRLRDAFYAAGGSTQVCVAAETVRCTAAVPTQSERHYNDTTTPLDPNDIAQLKPAHVVPGRIILAGAFGSVDGATISRVQPTGPVDGRLVVVANPDRQGIDYADLGHLGAGTYLVALYVPSLRTPTQLVEIIVEGTPTGIGLHRGLT